jgi:hypothetical protein
LLLHAPGGAFEGLDRLRETRLLQPAELLDRAAQQAVDDWATDAVRGLLTGPGRALFASHQDVHLGELNRLALDIDYLTLGTLNAAMRRAEHDLSYPVTWTLLGHDSGMLSASAYAAEQRGHRAYVLPPRPVAAIRDARARRRAATPLPPSRQDWRLPRADVLMISWTRPIDEMFAAVEEHLARHGATPALRVHFGDPPTERAELPGVSVVHAPAPESFGRMAPPAFGRVCGTLAGPAFDVDGGRFLQDRIAMVQRRVGPQMAFIDAAARMLDVVQPRLVVVGNDRWWVGQAVVQLARLRGIPTLCLQDGVAADAATWRWCAADRMLANGDQLRDVLARNGVAADRLVVTGQPRYDRLRALGAPDAACRIRARLGLPRNRRLVLFPSQYDQDPAFVEGIVDACLRVPDVHLMLRPHPSEPSTFHESLMNGRRDRVTLCRHEPIEWLVTACDALVAKSSTTTLEAAMLGKPVIVVHNRGTPMFAHLEAIRPILLHTADEIPSALRRLHDGSLAVDRDAGRKAFEYYCGPFDGESSARVAAQFAAALATATI